MSGDVSGVLVRAGVVSGLLRGAFPTWTRDRCKDVGFYAVVTPGVVAVGESLGAAVLVGPGGAVALLPGGDLAVDVQTVRVGVVL